MNLDLLFDFLTKMNPQTHKHADAHTHIHTQHSAHKLTLTCKYVA